MAKPNFQIKLLSGGSVVLVEAENYEPEIFTPTIDANQRITLVNIIANRRCCSLSKCHRTSIGNVIIKQEKSASSLHSTVPFRPPLANSTPGSSLASNKSNNVMPYSNITSNTFGSSTAFSLPTPEPLRRAVPNQQRSEIGDSIALNLPRNIKVMRLYHNSHSSPKNVGRLVKSSASNMKSVTREEYHNISDLSCTSFRVLTSTPSPRRSRVCSSTPIKPKAPNLPIQTNSTWDKFKTPIRTYSKRGVRSIRKNNSTKKTNVKENRFIPTYRVNPTKAPEPDYKVEVRRSKLVTDGKIRISSRALKRQQQRNQNKQLSTSNPGMPPCTSFTNLQKKRKIPMSAFDLLTNSNRINCISGKLNELFRRGCINKASSTHSKYKVLGSVPPLQNDKQVLEITLLQNSTYESAGQNANGNGHNNDVVSSTPLSQPVKNEVARKDNRTYEKNNLNGQILNKRPPLASANCVSVNKSAYRFNIKASSSSTLLSQPIHSFPTNGNVVPNNLANNPNIRGQSLQAIVNKAKNQAPVVPNTSTLNDKTKNGKIILNNLYSKPIAPLRCVLK
ncbi:univalents only [Haematobia irritans]|uniref:univalents only n=1 Tax=Haematobia irritans TaxID=7368 RepID=UPI003F50D307